MYEVAEIPGKGKGLVAKRNISVNETRPILVISDPMFTIVDTEHLETVCYCCYDLRSEIGTVGKFIPRHFHACLDHTLCYHQC